MKKYCYLLVLLSFVGIPRLVTAQVLQKIPPLPVTKVASNNTSRAIDDRFSNDGWSAANMTREKTIIKDSSVRLATATEQGTAQPVTTLPTTLPTMANKPTRIASFDSTSIQTSAVQPVTLPTNETLYRAVVGEQLVTDVYGNTNRQRVVTYMPVTTTEARDSCEIRTNTT
ncbi:MAG: hypothetical protein MPJ24_05140, partial [Pirellulaceae bacterium]|nr:hypothetical protein [Pirellulaceae bacterium]